MYLKAASSTSWLLFNIQGCWSVGKVLGTLHLQTIDMPEVATTDLLEN